MDKHVTNICRSAYIEIRTISSIRHYLTIGATKPLVCAFVMSKLDYCNSLLAGSPKTLLDKLQKVQHSAARLIFKARKQEHVNPSLKKTFTGYQLAQESSTESQLCSTTLSLKLVLYL